MNFYGAALAAISDNFVLPKSRILITGGLGFIFSYVAEWLVAHGHDVLILDACRDGSHPELIQEYQRLGMAVYQNDINEIEAAYNHDRTIMDFTGDGNTLNRQFDYIIHAAAESNVDKSIADGSMFYASNIAGTHVMLRWARRTQRKLKQFLFINTDEVYGSRADYPTPDAKFNPSSPYAASKAAASCLANCYRVTFDLPVKEFRLCNVIGKRQATTKLIPRAISCLLNKAVFPVYDGGEATREYLDVRLIGLIIEHFWAMCGIGLDTRLSSRDVQHITLNQERSISQVLAELSALTNKQFIIGEGHRPGHDMCYTMRRAGWLDVLPSIHFTDTLRWILSTSPTLIPNC